MDYSEFAQQMLQESAVDITKHLFSKNSHNYKSGYLYEEDILEIERITEKKVICSVESGEYFYKLQK